MPVGEWIRLVVQDDRRDPGSPGRTARALITYEDREHPLKTGGFGLRPWQRSGALPQPLGQDERPVRAVPFQANPDDSGPVSGMWRPCGAARRQASALSKRIGPLSGRNRSDRLPRGRGRGRHREPGAEPLGPVLRRRQALRRLRLGRAPRSRPSFSSALESRDGAQVYAPRPKLAVAGKRLAAARTSRSRPSADRRRARFAAEAEAARLRGAGPCVPPAGRVGPVQGSAGAPRRGGRDDRSGADRAALRRVDGQQRRVSLEEDDRPARPPAALQGTLVSATRRTAGASSTFSTSARRPGSWHPRVQHGRDAAGHGRLRRVRQRPGRQRVGQETRRRRPPGTVSAEVPGTGQRGARGRELLANASRPWPRPSGPSIRTSSWSSAISFTASRSPTRSTSRAPPPASPTCRPTARFSNWPDGTAARSGSTFTSAPSIPAPCGDTGGRADVRRCPGEAQPRRQAQGGRLRVELPAITPSAGPWPTPSPSAHCSSSATGCRSSARPTASSPTARTTTAGTRACSSSIRRRCGSSRPAM